MEGLCGIKSWKIGRAQYGLSTLLSALDKIDAADNINDGLRDAYEVLDSTKTSEKEFKDWYYSNAYEEGKITSKKITAEDIVGESDRVTKDAERLANVLNFERLKDDDSDTSEGLISRAKALKRQIFSTGPIDSERVLNELRIFDQGFDRESLKRDLGNKRKSAFVNVERNLAENPDYVATFYDLFNVDMDLLDDANQLQAYKVVQDAFSVRKKIIDLSRIEDLHLAALDILESLEVFKSQHVKKRVKKAGKEDSERTKKLNQQLLDLTKNIPALPVREQYKKRIRRAFEGVTEEDISKLTNPEKAAIIEGMESAKMGFIPFAFNDAVSVLLRKKEGKNNLEYIKTSEGYNGYIGKALAEGYDTLHDVFSQRPRKNVVGRKLEKEPKYLIDQTLGLDGVTLLKTLVEPLAAGNQAQADHFHQWSAEAELVTINHKKAFGNNRSKRARSHALVSLYMLEREAQSNKGKQGILTASAAIKNIEANYRRTSDYGINDVNMLKDLESTYAKDGVWDLKKMQNDMIEEEQAIVDFNDKSASAAMGMMSTIGVRNGKMPTRYKKYVHHSVIASKNGNDLNIDNYESYLLDGAPPVKANTLFERKSLGNNMIRLYDPVGSIVKAQKMLGLEYFMSENIRDVKSILDETLTLAEKEGNEETIAIALGVQQEMNDVIRKDILRKTEIPTISDRILQELFKQSYAAQLVSVPRMVSEATSNLAFAVLYKHEEFSSGMSDEANGNNMLGMAVLRVTDSASISRLYSNDEYVHFESTFHNANTFTKLKYMNPSAARLATINDAISNSKVWGGLKENVGRLSDWVMTAPDRMVAKPLWFGTFAKEFQAIAKKSIDYQTLTAQTKEGEAYRAEHATAIENARRKADMVAIQAGAPNEVYMSINRLQRDPGATAARNTARAVGFYMMRFALFEFASFQTAIKSMQGKGAISKEEGGRLLLATLARMSLYVPIYSALTHMISNLLGIGDEDDDLDVGRDLTRSFLGTLITLGLMRNMSVFGREPIAWGIETFNEAYLEGLRGGEPYDPYKHSLSFKLFREDDLEKKGIWGSALNFTGPLRPIIKDMERIYKYGTPADSLIFWLTYGGRLPFPKDWNRFNKQYQWVKSQEEKNKK